jgi:hypothetical protein
VDNWGGKRERKRKRYRDGERVIAVVVNRGSDYGTVVRRERWRETRSRSLNAVIEKGA